MTIFMIASYTGSTETEKVSRQGAMTPSLT